MGVDGVWLSFPISDLMALAVTSLMVWHQLKVIGRAAASVNSGVLQR